MIAQTSAPVQHASPGFTLTYDQRDALNKLQLWMDSPRQYFSLQGFAGTGKTFTLQAFISALRQFDRRDSICISAPTNKACRVVGKMASNWGLSIETMTCARLLGLRPKIDPKTGRQKFVPDRENEPAVSQYNLVLIDEASMVSEELYRHIEDGVQSSITQPKVLFVGDPAQLPPVGEIESPVFRAIPDYAMLTEVVRYSGAIAHWAEKIRKNLDNPEVPAFVTDFVEDYSSGLFFCTPDGWEQTLLRAFHTQADSVTPDPDKVRVLAWTNDTVDRLNTKVRTAIYGTNAPQYITGERLIAKDPCFNEIGDIILQTSEEMTINLATLETIGFMKEEWRVWRLEVESDMGAQLLLYALDQRDRMKCEKLLKELAKEAKETENWGKYYLLKNKFAPVQPCAGLTVHKSQGSTFQDVFISLPDILNRSKGLTVNSRSVKETAKQRGISTSEALRQAVIERNQLLYVALTRAAKRVFLYL